jgi:hypothetical protein
MNHTSWVNNQPKNEWRYGRVKQTELELVGLAGLIGERALVNVRAKSSFSSERMEGS